MTTSTRTLPEIREHLRRNMGSVRDPEVAELCLDAVMEQMPTLLQEVRTDERRLIADQLHALGDGRMEYVCRPDNEPTHSGEIDALEPRGMAQVVYGEATGARWLAKIIRGEIDDKGWLPSWRWHD